MPTTRKVLGQSSPAATTETVVYTVPASTEAIISTLTVCNRDATAASFRVGISVGGGALGAADYIYYDLLAPPNDTFTATIGLTLAAADEVRVYASTANLSFNIFGQEST